MPGTRAWWGSHYRRGDRGRDSAGLGRKVFENFFFFFIALTQDGIYINIYFHASSLFTSFFLSHVIFFFREDADHFTSDLVGDTLQPMRRPTYSTDGMYADNHPDGVVGIVGIGDTGSDEQRGYVPIYFMPSPIHA